MKVFGQRLKELRVKKGLSQASLAKELNVDKSTIAKYESNVNSPSVFMLIKIVKFFKVSSDYLLGRED